MELKKSNDANIEKLRIPITLMGLLFVGGLVLASFSYTTVEGDNSTKDKEKVVSQIRFEEEVVAPPPADTPPPTVDAEPPIDEEIIEKENEEKEPETQIPAPPPPLPPAKKEEPKIEVEFVEFPDKDALFPGGAAAMQRWIAENVEYPQVAREMGDQGLVYVSFIVEGDGSITDIKISRGVSDELDKEAKRVIRKMPNWEPAENGGKAVKTRCSLPIRFVLD